MEIDQVSQEDRTWCEVCGAHETGKCDNCKAPITQAQIWRSQTFHFHPAYVQGIPGTTGVHKHLCQKCYLLDFAKKYPKEPLPYRIVDGVVEPV